MSESDSEVMENVRRALGRRQPLAEAPVPPTPPLPPLLDEPVIRLVHSDIGLPELFARSAQASKMQVQTLYVEELHAKLIEFLKAHQCQKIALPVSPLLEKLGVAAALAGAGFDARLWDAMSLDELYDFDAGVTDVYAAIAETGSLVMRASPEHGRALSLVPPIHVAILEPANFVPDMFDIFQKLQRDGLSSGTTFITGPSKTSDIEMNLVVGVHGPMVVQLFILK